MPYSSSRSARGARLSRAAILALCFPSCSRRVSEANPVDGAASRTAPEPSAKQAEFGPLDSDDAGTPDRHTAFALEPLPAGAPFEGMVALQAVDYRESTTEYSTYYLYVKASKARWDLFADGGKGGPTGLRLYDGRERKFFTVVRQPVLYVTDETALAAAAGTPKSYAFSPFNLEPRATVAGVPCEKMETHDDEVQYEVCLASTIPPLPLHLLGPGLAKAVPFGAQLEKKGLFPLSVVARRSKRAPGVAIRPVTATLTALRIDRGRVPDAAFELPRFPVTETPSLVPPRLVR